MLILFFPFGTNKSTLTNKKTPMRYLVLVLMLLSLTTNSTAQDGGGSQWSDSKTLSLQKKNTAQTRTGKDYAVFFYVSSKGIDPIRFTKGEAEELARELSDNYGFTCSFVPECSLGDITSTLDAFNRRLGPNDQVLFFFSMHGYYDASSDRGYLIPADGDADAPSRYFKSWLSYDDLRTYLAPSKAGHILVALDACFSGSFGIRSGTKMGPQGSAAEEKPDCLTRVSTALKYKGRQYLSAGRTEQGTPKASAFAAEFLRTLRTANPQEGLIFYDELELRLKRLRNPDPEGGKFSGHSDGGDFVFVRKSACGQAPADRDGDGVQDSADQCPDQWGSRADGCPTDIPKNNDLAADLAAWKAAKALDTEAAYRDYLKHYSEFKDPANAALRRKEAQALEQADETAWNVAAEKDTPEGYQRYLDDFPQGKYRNEAGQRKAPADPMGLVPVKGGAFTMGCTSEQQDCESDEKPAHNVTLSDFYLGAYEVTQQQWQQIMGNNPSYFKDCDQCPVEQVSWEDVQQFLQKLNTRYPGRNYRLPTEAEWEYAARGGGKPVLFGNGKNVIDPAEINFDASADYKKSYSIAGEYRKKTVPVGSLRSPNALGLHDMSGNVYEWCSDWYGNYGSGSQTNPQGPTSGSSRVCRGGSWGYYPQVCRVANRYDFAPGFRFSYLGFRLARTK